ncbi:MAG: hypothetical protein ACI82F_004098, partial [Planctomycetota bacterium]
PALGPSRPIASTGERARRLQTLTTRPSLEDILEVASSGGKRAIPHVLDSGITPESNRRWLAFVDRVAALWFDLAK